jgi:hypothetical protein
MREVTSEVKHRPAVFRYIVANDLRRSVLHDKIFSRTPERVTLEEWKELRGLIDDRRHNLTPSAERALCWNVDKGDFDEDDQEEE